MLNLKSLQLSDLIPNNLLFDLAQDLAASPEKLERALVRLGVVSDNSNLTSKEKVKILEGAILRMGQSSAWAFENDAELRLFVELVLWNREIREQLIQPDFLLHLMKIVGIEGNDEPKISVVSSRSANFCFFVSIGNKSIFMRYHDPMGLTWLPRHSPTRSTAIYTLAAQVFRDVLSEKEVVKVLWPSVTDSFKWIQNDWFDNIEDILARRCVFQPDLRATTTRLDWLPQNGWTYKDTACLYGKTVGRLHGRSIKVLSSSKGKICRNNSALPSSLQRFPNSTRYGGYIRYAGWIPQLINQVSKIIERNLKIIGCGMIEPKSYWTELCDESIQAFKVTPVLGHMDLKMGNLYLDSNGNVLFTDFDYITRIDPAFEVGQCIYSLTRRYLDARVEEVENFVDHYLEEYLSAFRKETGYSPDWIARSSGFGAMTILGLSFSSYASPILSSIKAIGPVIRILLERASVV